MSATGAGGSVVRKLASIWAVLRPVFLTLGVAVATITFTPLTQYWTLFLSDSYLPRKAEVAVVLAAASLEDGTLIDGSFWRCTHAVWAFRAGRLQRFIVSGGGTGVSTALAMERFLVANGVPKERIQREEVSTTTRESAMEVRRLLGTTRTPIVLVTSDYHTFRSRKCFTKVGFQVASEAVPDALKRSQFMRLRWAVFQDLIIETVKITYYAAKGWI